MGKFILIKAGGTFEDLRRSRGDFEEWTIGGMGVEPSRVQVVRVCEGEIPPVPDDAAGIVVTGSHAMVTDREAWSEKLCPWIVRALEKEVPFLGICYGHQLLAHALGGEVGNHPSGPEVGTVRISLRAEALNDPLFGATPPSFLGHATHTQSVLRLPPGTQPLGFSDWEPYHAVKFGPLAWGIQFHPEFDVCAMNVYVEAQAAKLRRTGQDPDDIRLRLRETPDAAAVLARFSRAIARNRD